MPERPTKKGTGGEVRHVGDLISQLTRRHVMIGATATAVSNAPVRAFGSSLTAVPFDLDNPDHVTELLLRMSGIPQERPGFSWVLSRVFSVDHGQRTALYDQCSVTSAFYQTRPDGVRHIESDSITELRALESDRPLEMLTDPTSHEMFAVPAAETSHQETEVKPKFQQLGPADALHCRSRRQMSSVVCTQGFVRMSFQEQTLSTSEEASSPRRISSEQRTYQARQRDISDDAVETIPAQFSYSKEQGRPHWLDQARGITSVKAIGSGGAVGSMKELPQTAWHLASQLG